MTFTPGTLAARARTAWPCEVSDNGAGFDPAASARLFEPFEQGPDVPERTGLGLGLAICRGVMELHGGTITASSRGAGLGARFVVELGDGD